MQTLLRPRGMAACHFFISSGRSMRTDGGRRERGGWPAKEPRAGTTRAGIGNRVCQGGRGNTARVRVAAGPGAGQPRAGRGQLWPQSGRAARFRGAGQLPWADVQEGRRTVPRSEHAGRSRCDPHACEDRVGRGAAGAGAGGSRWGCARPAADVIRASYRVRPAQRVRPRASALWCGVRRTGAVPGVCRRR